VNLIEVEELKGRLNPYPSGGVAGLKLKKKKAAGGMRGKPLFVFWGGRGKNCSSKKV